MIGPTAPRCRPDYKQRADPRWVGQENVGVLFFCVALSGTEFSICSWAFAAFHTLRKPWVKRHLFLGDPDPIPAAAEAARPTDGAPGGVLGGPCGPAPFSPAVPADLAAYKEGGH